MLLCNNHHLSLCHPIRSTKRIVYPTVGIGVSCIRSWMCARMDEATSEHKSDQLMNSFVIELNFINKSGWACTLGNGSISIIRIVNYTRNNKTRRLVPLVNRHPKKEENVMTGLKKKWMEKRHADILLPLPLPLRPMLQYWFIDMWTFFAAILHTPIYNQ